MGWMGDAGYSIRRSRDALQEARHCNWRWKIRRSLNQYQPAPVISIVPGFDTDHPRKGLWITWKILSNIIVRTRHSTLNARMLGWKLDYATWKWNRFTAADPGGWESIAEQPEQVQFPNWSWKTEEHQIIVPATIKPICRESAAKSNTTAAISETTMPDWLYHEHALHGPCRRPNERNHSEVAQQAWKLHEVYHASQRNSEPIEVWIDLPKGSA